MLESAVRGANSREVPGENGMQAETWKARTEVDQGKKNPDTSTG